MKHQARDHVEPTWENQLWHAEKLYAEKGRAALDNPHAMIGRACRCMDCFCCAAMTVVTRHDLETWGARKVRR